MKQRTYNSAIIEKNVENKIVFTMEKDAAEAGVQFRRAGSNGHINRADGDNLVEEITREEVVQDITGLENGSDDNIEVDGDTEENNEEEYSVEDQLRILANDKVTLERHGLLKFELLHAFSKAKHDLRLKRQEKLTKTSISDFFSKE